MTVINSSNKTNRAYESKFIKIRFGVKIVGANRIAIQERAKNASLIVPVVATHE